MGLIPRLIKFLSGNDNGPTKAEIVQMAERDCLSSYLPWVAYDPDTHLYENIDDTHAFLWECSPLFFAGESTTKTLEGLFRQGLPTSSIMQFVLTAEPYVMPLLYGHAASKKRATPIISRMTNQLCEFYDKSKSGMEQIGGTPLRNFRLFIAIKWPKKESEHLNLRELFLNLQELLKGARLSPQVLTPSVLLDFMRRLMNDEPGMNSMHYDDAQQIRKQVIKSETVVRADDERIKVGLKYFRCLTPHSFPKRVNPFQTNQLFGGVMGAISDADQLKTPFIYSLNISMENLSAKIGIKCNFILRQDSILPSDALGLADKKNEYMHVVKDIGDGKMYLRVIPTLFVYGNDKHLVTSAVARAKQMWEAQGYRMQEDRKILMPLFIATMPCGLYNVSGNITMLERDFIGPADAVAAIMPVQGDFSGFGEPIIPLIGRKGELFGIDLWAHNSHNALICATTGVGKSFKNNIIVNNYYGAGAKIRIIDIGGSYKKNTCLHGAKFLDFSPGSNIGLNPFTNVTTNSPEDTEADIMTIPPIVAQMCYSASDESPSNTDMTLVQHAVRFAWREKGREACIDDIHHYLINFRKYCDEGGADTEDRAKNLALNLTNFCSWGAYGKFFCGPSTFNIKDDDFVVLELEHLEQHKPLFKVVTLQIINAVTQDLYLGSRDRKKLVIFDEAWKFLGENSAIKMVIEEGYRRARKYNGSFTIITQSILDMIQFGSVGKVIRGQSAFKFFLESPDFENAQNEKLIDYSPFVMDILKSISSKPPKYSEVFIDSPFGLGVGRLVVDRFNYFANTSSATEVQRIEGLVDRGISYEGAIDIMVEAERLAKAREIPMEAALEEVLAIPEAA